MEYLGYFIAKEGIRPVEKKVEAIMNLAPPTTKKQLRCFIGLVNFYRDMWQHRSTLLAPLTKLTSKSVPWKWTDVEQKAFDDMKKVMSRQTLLVYPNFSQPFHIFADGSKVQLGAVIMQNGKPVAFYSRNINPAKINDTN